MKNGIISNELEYLKSFFLKTTEYILTYGIKIIFLIILWFIGKKVIKIFLSKVLNPVNANILGRTSSLFLNSALNIILQLVLVLMLLSSFGIPTGSLIAVLGSAGLAIGLSLQGVLSNIVGGFMVLTFDFFKVGDFIKCEEEEGVVENMQIFFTTLKTAENKIIKIPNNRFINSSVVNFTMVKTRRMTLLFQVPYSVNLEKLQERLLNLAASSNIILKEPSPTVHINAYDPHYIEIAFKAWTPTARYWDGFYDLIDNIKDVLIELKLEVPIKGPILIEDNRTS